MEVNVVLRGRVYNMLTTWSSSIIGNVCCNKDCLFKAYNSYIFEYLEPALHNKCWYLVSLGGKSAVNSIKQVLPTFLIA